MIGIEKLGFDNWFKDKVYLSKNTDLKIARVISVNKITQWPERLLVTNSLAII